MHRIERAIIMAAGKGERMHPLTEKTPKPLIRVRGKRMIETVIEALHANGIRSMWWWGTGRSSSSRSRKNFRG